MGDLSAVTIKGVCLDDHGRVLLCRNDRGEWELPGGRPHLGEPFPSCLTREIAEETGLRTAVLGLLDAYPYEVLPGRWITVIVYGCETVRAARPSASEEHDQVAFMDLAEIDAGELPAGYREAILSWIQTIKAGSGSVAS
ncbi:MAG TPA: NUDIX hydrolase [Solirubrobacteraceae bacterium]|nr:NUDIX hydrolase [Solirubrobacteraceae bacterium]